jgi:hypothetical protein
VLQFCPQAPVKSIEIALALSTLATVSLTEESFTRIANYGAHLKIDRPASM